MKRIFLSIIVILSLFRCTSETATPTPTVVSTTGIAKIRFQPETVLTGHVTRTISSNGDTSYLRYELSNLFQHGPDTVAYDKITVYEIDKARIVAFYPY